MESIFWFCLMIATGIIEALTAGLVTIWFTFGALLALIAATLGANVAIQIITFIVASGFLLLLTRPMVKKYVSSKKVNTNSDRLIGKECLVTEDIDNLKGTGAVKVLGLVWSAKSEYEDDVIKKDSCVTITKIEGVHAIVKEK